MLRFRGPGRDSYGIAGCTGTTEVRSCNWAVQPADSFLVGTCLLQITAGMMGMKLGKGVLCTSSKSLSKVG